MPTFAMSSRLPRCIPRAGALHMHRRLHEILQHGQMRPQVEALEHHAEFGSDAVDLTPVGGLGPSVARRRILMVSPADRHDAFVRSLQQIDAAAETCSCRSRDEPRIEITSPSLAVSDTPRSTSSWPKLLCIVSTVRAGVAAA